MKCRVKYLLFLIFFLLSTVIFAIPLDNIDKEGNVTLPNIELFDQYGKKHSLDDYKGKVVLISFWVTWCSDCAEEIPHIEKLYKEYGKNKNDVVFLGVVNPKSESYPNNRDRVYKKEVLEYIKNNVYTFPSLFDETGEVYDKYEIEEYPSTFIINKKGHLKFYIKGRVSKEDLKEYINNTLK